jgi:hypothetical protein
MARALQRICGFSMWQKLLGEGQRVSPWAQRRKNNDFRRVKRKISLKSRTIRKNSQIQIHAVFDAFTQWVMR